MILQGYDADGDWEEDGNFPGAGVQNGKEDPSKAEKGIWVKIRSWDTGGSVFQLLVCL